MAQLSSLSRRRRRRAKTLPAAAAGRDRPDGLRLIPVESASATARPQTIDSTYLELAHDAQALEQQHLFVAEGEARSRDDAATAGALAFAETETMASVARAKTAADNAAVRSEKIRELLGPYRRRKATSFYGYVARTAALLLGDIAGLSGAAIALGEYPALAVVQAISAGTATVTAGLAATQLRHAQQAGERHMDDIPYELKPHAYLFSGPPTHSRLYTAVYVVAALIAVLVSLGVFALRTGIEGPLSGLTFGGLAAAIALASFINSWFHADAVADAVESAEHHAHAADRRHRRLAGARVVRTAEQAASQAKSLIIEHTHRGLAAAAHIEAEKYRALLASPDVVGHGPAPEDRATPTSTARPSIKRARSA